MAKQLNLRLDESTWQVLEILAFLEGRSVVDLVRPEIEALAKRRADEPGVRSARRARKESEAFRTGDMSASGGAMTESEAL
jgi:hypothetical protein